jgi:2-methylfumaryl-CoA isomerase
MPDLLSGVSIIEAASFVAAPSAALYLAQLGADVVRVDQIGGGPDFGRWPLADNGASLYWENLNRAKRSVALDLRQEEGRELLCALAAHTGQLVTNLPVGGFLAHDRLAALRPDMITVRVMGTADGGSALDYTVNAAVGIPQITGPAALGDAPVNHVLPAWDLLTGAYAAFALLAGLRRREASGAGGELRIALQDVAIGSIANLGMVAEAVLSGHDRERLGNDVFGAFGRDFVTADGQRVMLMAITPRQWAGLVAVLDLAEAVAGIEHSRSVSFATSEGTRFAHRDALFPLVEAAVARRQSGELLEALERQQCCFALYRSVTQAARTEGLVAGNAMFSHPDNPSNAHYPAAAAFLDAPGSPRLPARPAPVLGADTAAVLAERLDLSPAHLDALRDKGVIPRI